MKELRVKQKWDIGQGKNVVIPVDFTVNVIIPVEFTVNVIVLVEFTREKESQNLKQIIHMKGEQNI